MYQPPLGFKKGIQKERWEIKGLVLKNRTNYCKIQIIQKFKFKSRVKEKFNLESFKRCVKKG